MEYLALSSSKLPVVPCLSTAKDVEIRRWSPFPLLSVFANGRGMRRSNFFIPGSFSIRCENRHEPSQIISRTVMRKIGMKNFASISSSNISEISTVCTAPQTTVPPPPYYFGSPLFWVGVGVGLSALFSLVSTRVKQYAMQQAFKTMMSQTPQNGELSDAAFPDVRPFSFPSITQSSPSISLTPNFTLQPVAVEDHPPTKTEDSPPPPIESKEQSEREPKKYAFVDVSPAEVLSPEYAKEPFSQIESQSEEEVSQNGAPYKTENENFHQQSETSTSGSVLSVQALEKMMEDPNVQKLVYPYLPEEMRNPTSFKWMLQNPQYRQQLQDMLNKMGGSRDWENLMVGTLKNFDLSNPQIKEQFDQIGLTPEQVISKIMANPDVALAFQNPKVQAALMDCTQNPLSIAKYQNDKEVMDVLMKISKLFPGTIGTL